MASFFCFLGSDAGGAYFKDLQGRFVLINRTLAKALKVGVARGCRCKSDSIFFTAEHAGSGIRDEQEIVRTGRPLLDKEEKEDLAGWRITWASTSKMPLRNKDGRVIGTFGFSRDVTQNRRMRETLIESEAHLASASEELTNGQQVNGIERRRNSDAGQCPSGRQSAGVQHCIFGCRRRLSGAGIDSRNLKKHQ